MPDFAIDVDALGFDLDDFDHADAEFAAASEEVPVPSGSLSSSDQPVSAFRRVRRHSLW